jgi:hypothetical protein
MRLTGGPAEYGITRQIPTHLQTETGMAGIQTVFKNSTGPGEWISQFFDFVNTIDVFLTQTTDQRMWPVRHYGHEP